MSDNNSTSSGIGFTGLLLIAFIVLKLCNVINWSWWWVLSPAWISVGLAILLIAGYAGYWLIKSTKAKRKYPKSVGKDGRLKSKWQERLDQMKEAQEKAKQNQKS